MYSSIKSLYTSTNARLRLNGNLTAPFDTTSGVRQGDNLSPTLFSLFINDIVSELNALNCGISIGGTNYCVLLYADDIVLFSDSEANLQKMLDQFNIWCRKCQ